MKISVVFDVPKEGIMEPLKPFEVEVKLDYGDRVICLDGEVKNIDS